MTLPPFTYTYVLVLKTNAKLRFICVTAQKPTFKQCVHGRREGEMHFGANSRSNSCAERIEQIESYGTVWTRSTLIFEVG
ncbi:hypothetical protein L596_011897 [Steinernema carpocapsae]|uniref:Uncharacterized protein n=1 Tax=Steinernema carpocapsae TaxID=34508 RepID=A0A4U5NVG3_STECR|nr:hypothetical protein L596_011897 [Steinernema carpocapsae]